MTPARRPSRALLRLALALLACLAMLAAGSRASAARLTPEELDRLAAGEVVAREIDADLGAGHYIGGISYAIVHAPPEVVMEALLDVGAYREIFPLTLEAREVERRGQDRFVYFRHGSRFGSAVYTARVRRESAQVLRFWMDPSAPHEFDDAFGYFRVEPAGPGATLLTYGAVIDLGFGFLRIFFEQKVRRYALDTPGLVQRYVERRPRGRLPASAAASSGPPRAW